MNHDEQRKQFEVWWDEFKSIHEEWRFADTDALLLNSFIAGAESKQSELDKANARIAQLEESLKLLFDEAKYQSTRGGWTDRFELDVAKSRLMESSDTWLSEHDKAVEVKVLEEAAQKCRYYLKNQNYQIYENTNDPYEHGVIIATENIEDILIKMIESRK